MIERKKERRAGERKKGKREKERERGEERKKKDVETMHQQIVRFPHSMGEGKKSERKFLL